MAEAVLVTALVLFVHLADSWLRYLPFAARLDDAIKQRLRRRLIAWSIAVAPIYFAIFVKLGIIALSYKIILMIGWIPFVLISLLTVKGRMLQHLFVVGMSMLWILMQNNWASIINVLFFLDEPESTFLILHSIDYLILFAATLPIERRYFSTLLPDDAFFDNRPQSYYITLMPLVIGLGHLLLWADEQLVHSWAERFSRLYLPVMFFFIYRYVLAGAQTFFEHRRTMRKSQMMDEQLRALERHNRAMSNNRRQMEALRDNLRAEYDELIEMLRAGDLDGVRRHIEAQEAILEATKIIKFCRAPLINAALSIYIHQAERHKIACRHKINLPAEFSTNENDFAILLSNVLENAINASRKQPAGARAMSIIVQHQGRQCVLEVANRFDGELQIGEDGLPATSCKGHGIGMKSIKSFATKYGAQAAFDQSDGYVRFSMYWIDGGRGERLDDDNVFGARHRRDATDGGVPSIFAVSFVDVDREDRSTESEYFYRERGARCSLERGVQDIRGERGDIQSAVVFGMVAVFLDRADGDRRADEGARVCVRNGSAVGIDAALPDDDADVFSVAVGRDAADRSAQPARTGVLEFVRSAVGVGAAAV